MGRGSKEETESVGRQTAQQRENQREEKQDCSMTTSGELKNGGVSGETEDLALLGAVDSFHQSWQLAPIVTIHESPIPLPQTGRAKEGHSHLSGQDTVVESYYSPAGMLLARPGFLLLSGHLSPSLPPLSWEKDVTEWKESMTYNG